MKRRSIILFKMYHKAVLAVCLSFIGISLYAATQLAPTPTLPTGLEAPGKPGKPGHEEDLTFNLSEADIKNLNLNDSEAAELRQFFDALNNLSPDEKQQLKDLGAETEKKMREKKMDPTNFDDLVKFMEEEEREAKGEKAPARVSEIEEKPSKPVEKQAIIPVTKPKDTLSLLKDIERRTESLSVKAKSREALNKKLSSLQQELSEFRYYIKILQAPDLVVLLGSKEFEGLHRNLETLHKTLAGHEPAIVARKRSGDVDDPYEMLSLEYTATPAQIKQAYKTLKENQSPEAIEKELKTSGLSEKDQKKRRKEARLSWSFIQDAYETLIDPNERAIARKELKNKIDEEARHDRTSRAAFDKIYTAFTTAFYPQAMLSSIKSLLERHKPQELEIAKKTLEAEKKVAERAKQVVRVETTPPRYIPEPTPHKEFWDKMAQESYMRPQYPMTSIPTAAPVSQEKPGGTESESKKGADRGKKKEKEDKEKKEREEKEKKEKKEKAAKKKITEKDVPKLSAIGEIEKILKEAKDTIEVPIITRSKAEEEAEADKENRDENKAEDSEAEIKTHPISFDAIALNLAQDLKKPVTRGVSEMPEAAFNARQFFNINRFADLAKALNSLAPGDKKLDKDSKICSEWKDKIWNQHGGKLKKWVKAFYTDISHVSGSRIDHTKAELYGIGADHQEPTEFFKKKKEPKKDKTPAKSKAKKPKKEGPEEAPAQDDAEKKAAKDMAKQINLAEIRDTTKAINVYFDNISKACGLGNPPLVPIKKTAEKKEEKEKDEDEE